MVLPAAALAPRFGCSVENKLENPFTDPHAASRNCLLMTRIGTPKGSAVVQMNGYKFSISINYATEIAEKKRR